jgi:hypothetical protein
VVEEETVPAKVGIRAIEMVVEKALAEKEWVVEAVMVLVRVEEENLVALEVDLAVSVGWEESVDLGGSMEAEMVPVVTV